MFNNPFGKGPIKWDKHYGFNRPLDLPDIFKNWDPHYGYNKIKFPDSDLHIDKHEYYLPPEFIQENLSSIIEILNTFSIQIDKDHKGFINSDDCEGEGIKISNRKDILNLINTIDEAYNSKEEKWFTRFDDGVKIMVYCSTKKEGYFIIERENGNWFRLSSSALLFFQNALKSSL